MNYVMNKQKPEIGDKGSVIGNRFIKISNDKIKMPMDGLIFHASLNGKKSNIAETGQELKVIKGTPEYMVYKNVPCCNFNGLRIDVDELNIPVGNSPRSLCCWIYGISNSGWKFCFGFGGADNYTYSFGFLNNTIRIYQPNGDMINMENRWMFLVGTFDGSKLKVYSDCVKKYETNTRYNTNLSSQIYLGYLKTQNNYDWNSKIAGCRIYNRVLTEEQIDLLFTEYQPQ